MELSAAEGGNCQQLEGVISSRRRELSAAEGGSYLQLMEGVISS